MVRRFVWASLLVLLLSSAATAQAAPEPQCGGLCAIKPQEGGCSCHSNCTCQAGRLPGQVPSSLPGPSTPVAEAGGRCGPRHSARCMSGQCCSVAANYCGVTAEHCLEAKCLSGWGNCGSEYATSAGAVSAEEANRKPDPTTKLAVPGGSCGPANNARCPGSQCCSLHGFCGVTPEHCSPGKCIAEWGWCDGAPPSSGSSSSDSGASSSKNVFAMTADRIAIVVGTTLGGVSAIVAIAYTAWKWHLKRKAVKVNSFFSGRCSHQSSSSTSWDNDPSPGPSSGPDHDAGWPKVKSLGLGAPQQQPLRQQQQQHTEGSCSSASGGGGGLYSGNGQSKSAQGSQANLLGSFGRDQQQQQGQRGRQPQGDLLA